SLNSRTAQASSASPWQASPLGMLQAPISLFFQNGPPGWTSRTSRPLGRLRYINRPELMRGMSGLYREKVECSHELHLVPTVAATPASPLSSHAKRRRRRRGYKSVPGDAMQNVQRLLRLLLQWAQPF